MDKCLALGRANACVQTSEDCALYWQQVLATSIGNALTSSLIIKSLRRRGGECGVACSQGLCRPMDQRHRHLVCKVREPCMRACVPQHVWDSMHAARSQALPACVHARGGVLTPSHDPLAAAGGCLWCAGEPSGALPHVSARVVCGAQQQQQQQQQQL